MTQTQTCKKCKGTGALRKGSRCPTCGGSGQVLVTRDKEGAITDVQPAQPRDARPTP